MAILIAPEILMNAYRQGAFPMAVAPGDIQWFSPKCRGILPLDGFRVPHGARRTLKDPAWEIRVNTAFDAVIEGCSERSETWIDDVIARSYGALHRQGMAHSVEVWREGSLAGGLYGVSVGGAFCGESMFSREPGASKVALTTLVRILRAGGYTLLDTQWLTPHLAQFGGIEIPRRDYLARLAAALQVQAVFRWPLDAVGMPLTVPRGHEDF